MIVACADCFGMMVLIPKTQVNSMFDLCYCAPRSIHGFRCFVWSTGVGWRRGSPSSCEGKLWHCSGVLRFGSGREVRVQPSIFRLQAPSLSLRSLHNRLVFTFEDWHFWIHCRVQPCGRGAIAPKLTFSVYVKEVSMKVNQGLS